MPIYEIKNDVMIQIFCCRCVFKLVKSRKRSAISTFHRSQYRQQYRILFYFSLYPKRFTLGSGFSLGVAHHGKYSGFLIHPPITSYNI